MISDMWRNLERILENGSVVDNLLAADFLLYRNVRPIKQKTLR